MFKAGSLWTPPTKNIYTAGMPDHIFEQSMSDKVNNKETAKHGRGDSKSKRSSDASDRSSKKSSNTLSDSQRDRFEDMLRNLLPDRNPIAETMVWCIEHAEAGVEVVDCIAESLGILQTPLTKKIARLYLISDILHNCSVKGVPNVSFYRKGFQAKLPEIFSDLHQAYGAIESRIRAEAFKQRVMNCFRAWEDWALYPQDFLIKMQNIFLGFVTTKDESENGNDDKDVSDDDDDVDGIPLDGAALLKSAQKSGSTPSFGNKSRGNANSDEDSDVDGVPLDYVPPPKAKAAPTKQAPAGFVPSKWETVDPEEVQAQAVTSKWDIFDQDEANKAKHDDDDIDGIPLQEDAYDSKLDELTRQRLRDVEVKVMCYQDNLEAGKESIKPGWTISEQVLIEKVHCVAFF